MLKLSRHVEELFHQRACAGGNVGFCHEVEALAGGFSDQRSTVLINLVGMDCVGSVALDYRP